jgi:hypothetical protein
MSRLHYYAAMLFLVASLFTLVGHSLARSSPGLELTPSGHVNPPSGTAPLPGAQGWFQAMKPYCNTVEVEIALRNNPAPEGLDGTAYAAACLALAGKIDAARAAITALPAGDRAAAAGVVFDVAHPIADAGDDQSAGPIMGLVVEFWPNHYMALYHAGMAIYGLGNADLAKKYLEQFMELYRQEDGWSANAREVLGRLR